MHQKCIPNIYLLRKFQKNPKCIKSASQIPIFPLPAPPDQFLNILCLLHIHPQLLHIILNSHISVPLTHPNTINFVKCKWLPTISLNFFSPSLQPPGPILKHIMYVTHPPPITPPYPQFPHFNHLKQKEYFHQTTDLLQKK